MVYVIARHLMNAGVTVKTIVLAKLDDIKGDAKINLDVLKKMDGIIWQVMDIAALDDYQQSVMKSDLIVDAVLGTGISQDVKDFYAHAINFINGVVGENGHIRVFAVDIPSGVNADTGQVMGVAVRADATASFGMLKVGLLCHPGAGLCGEVSVVDISIPNKEYEDVPYSIFSDEMASLLLPQRNEDAHKGSVGHGIVFAGSPGKTGAAVMAGESSLKAGAGLVTLAGPKSIHDILEIKTLEIMTCPLPETKEKKLGTVSVKNALSLIDKKTAVALGPGIGDGKETTAFVQEIIKNCAIPLVIDADGLNALAQDVTVLKEGKGPIVLTPHPGEMSRLCGKSVKEINADRLGTALDFAKEHNVVLVLKGARTITALPDGKAFFNLSGNPGMATGGTGDVLTGLITGLLCQGLDIIDAAVLSVFIHGMAGDLACEEFGEEGLVAGDVMKMVPEVFKYLRRNRVSD